MRSANDLPNDLDALRALVLEQQALIISREARIAAQDAALANSADEIQRLTSLLIKLRRMYFGQKSEKLAAQIEQLELALEALELDRAIEPPPMPRAAPQPPAIPVRQTLPEHLPREECLHTPGEQQCPSCAGELRHLGEDVSEVLEFVPEHFKVVRHIRPKLACTRCDTIVQAPTPSKPIARGLAGPGLLAHVLVSKYADHLPLYRQHEIYARQGVELATSTMADWVGACSKLLAPLTEALKTHVLGGTTLHADDTPVPVLAPGLGKTRTARLWTYVRDERPAAGAGPTAVWFAYSQDRKGEHPQTHLATFTGALHADGYAGFDKLYENGRIVEVACWAHARRKFYDLQVAHKSPTATEALRRIQELYEIEAQVRGRPPDERRTYRQHHALPRLLAMRQWFDELLTKLSRKSDTCAAVRYALARWDALVRYTDDGRYEVSVRRAPSSITEALIREFALAGHTQICVHKSNCGHEFDGNDRRRGGAQIPASFDRV